MPASRGASLPSDTPGVIADFVAWIRLNGRLDDLKASAVLRGCVVPSGARRFADVVAILNKWYGDNHIEEIYDDSGGFRFAESLDKDELELSALRRLQP